MAELIQPSVLLCEESVRICLVNYELILLYDLLTMLFKSEATVDLS